jgi:hypothetical protein
MSREIIMDFAPDGTVIIEVHGHKGEGCRELTRNIEAALGQIVESNPTAEAYENESENNSNRA